VRKGFLLNHLISDTLPGGTANSDPVTGQAGWYDVRVRIYPDDGEQGVAFEKAKPPAAPSAHDPLIRGSKQ
ncbi:MAG TPA: hypothetical protein VJQ58_09785, partial [Burkholderiales bacterium]|nr:hypothetical protein [Burkholderiales bacterium]